MSNLPKGWELVQFDKVCDIRDGTHDSPKYIENGVPFITSKHLTDNGIDFTETNYISEENHIEFSKRSKVDNGDILFGMIGTIGKPVIVNTDFEFSIKNVALLKLSSNELLSNIYVLNLLKSNIIINQFLKLSNGGVQSFIALGMIRKLKIPLPPIEEQKKIADILSTVDKKIAFVEENINATEELKKGLMQKLLTEGIGHTEFKDSELGRIPESWEVIPFIELADKNIKHSFTGGPFGSDLKSEHYTDIGVRVIQLQNIGDGYFINNDFVYVSEEKAELLKSCQIYPNDIILAKMAEPVARACLIPDFESKYVMCSDGIRLKVDNSKFNTEFIFYSINYDNFRKIAVARSNGTTRLRIGLSALKSIPILIPPLEEQKQIAEILSTVDKKLENLKEKKQSFEELKKGLMQKLLTGEVRV